METEGKYTALVGRQSVGEAETRVCSAAAQWRGTGDGISGSGGSAARLSNWGEAFLGNGGTWHKERRGEEREELKATGDGNDLPGDHNARWCQLHSQEPFFPLHGGFGQHRF